VEERSIRDQVVKTSSTHRDDRKHQWLTVDINKTSEIEKFGYDHRPEKAENKTLTDSWLNNIQERRKWLLHSQSIK